MKKISVIIPCFNVAKWLPQCFLSLVQQTIGIHNLELIFVNDASTDDGATWELLKEMEQAYPEDVLIIDLPENRHQGGARNEGLKYATGEYISFVDADDWVEIDLYEKVYGKAKAGEAEIVQFGQYLYMDEIVRKTDSSVPDKIIYITNPEERKKWLVFGELHCGCWNKIYKRELIEQANVQFAEHVIYEEPLFVYPLYFYVSRMVIMQEPLYYHRLNASGTMYSKMQKEKTLMEHAQVQLAVWKFMKNTEFFHTYYEEIKLYFLHSYLYETLFFAKSRGFYISLEMFLRLVDVVKSEIDDYDESPYAKDIPEKMILYKAIRNGDFTEDDLQNYMNSVLR